jgi:hypothetical protein
LEFCLRCWSTWVKESVGVVAEVVAARAAVAVDVTATGNPAAEVAAAVIIAVAVVAAIARIEVVVGAADDAAPAA